MPDRNTYLNSLRGMERIKKRLRYAIEKMEAIGDCTTNNYQLTTNNYRLIINNIRAMRTLINQTYHHGKAIV